jgi:hypothetical protein
MIRLEQRGAVAFTHSAAACHWPRPPGTFKNGDAIYHNHASLCSHRRSAAGVPAGLRIAAGALIGVA